MFLVLIQTEMNSGIKCYFRLQKMFFSVPNLFGYIKIFFSGDQFNILD